VEWERGGRRVFFLFPIFPSTPCARDACRGKKERKKKKGGERRKRPVHTVTSHITDGDCGILLRRPGKGKKEKKKKKEGELISALVISSLPQRITTAA